MTRDEGGQHDSDSSISGGLLRLYKAMDDRFGDLHWWPGDSALEILIGAVLTQNTAWRNVELAISNLKQSGLIHIDRILQAEPSLLEALLRPSGFFHVKTARLKNLLQFVKSEYTGNLERMFAEDLWLLREKLLAIRGIGEETADCILLYGGGKTIFVVDAYTRRILGRHGFNWSGATYGEVQAFFMNHLPPDPALFGQFHALLVEVGKGYCKKIPQCGSCPLGSLMAV